MSSLIMLDTQVFKLCEKKTVYSSHSNQAVLGEIEVCPLDAARDQFEIMFWGPVYICKEVSRLDTLLKC